jgi:RNA polymerase sigma-70 factor (ECF subfamily)
MMGTATFALPLEQPLPVPDHLSDLYERYASTVYRTAYRVSGNASDAEDVLQTVFLNLLHRGAPVDEARAPESYLKRSAANAAIDLLRKKSSRAEAPLDHGSPKPARSGNEVLKHGLRQALARLPERDAELFVLRYIEGLSNIELAEMFSMERITVATRLHRIRQKLQEELK